MSRKSKSFVAAMIDTVWAGVDWAGKTKQRVKDSKQDADKRREERWAEAERRLEEDESNPEAERAEPKSEPEAKSGKSRFALKLKRKEKKPKAEPKPNTHECPACGHANHPPLLFCEECHESFIEIGKFPILILLSLALSCFFAAEYFKADMDWPWPLYVFYMSVFLIINIALMRKARLLSTTVLLWGATFLLGGLFVAFFGVDAAKRELSDIWDTFSDYLREPAALAAFLGGMSLALLILLLWMRRLYTFSYSYRIAILCGAAAAYGARFLYDRVDSVKRFFDKLSFIDRGDAPGILELMGLNLLRVLAAEIVVYALVKSYKPAMEAFAERRILPRGSKGAGGAKPADQSVEVIYRFALMIANGATRSYLQIEQAFFALVAIGRQFAIHLGHFLWTITRDLLLPAASLSGAAVAIYYLSIYSGEYIESRGWGVLARAGAATSGLLAMQIVFLASKTRIDLSRLATSELLLAIWFSPYMLTLLIFISISLYAVGLVMVRWNESLDYAFKVGPITLGAIALTLAFLVYAVVIRHREGDDDTDSEEVSGES